MENFDEQFRQRKADAERKTAELVRAARLDQTVDALRSRFGSDIIQASEEKYRKPEAPNIWTSGLLFIHNAQSSKSAHRFIL